jgi:zinc protease
MAASNAISTRSLPGADDIHRVLLPNGIVVLTRANFNSPSVVISGYLPAGGLFDPDEKLGLADFTASALMRGTEDKDFQTLYDSLESIGASLGFRSGTHNIGFSGRSLVEDLSVLLEIFSETVLGPAYPPDQVEKVRAQLLTGLAIRAQDTSDMASLTFDEILYDGHPYSRSDEGWPETIARITREDLIKFHEEHYGPKGMVISIVGAVQPEAAVAEVERFLGNWRNPARVEPLELPEFTPPRKNLRRHRIIAGKSQSDIVMGSPGPRRRAPEYLPASLGNNILGQFGLMGRIGDVVRERSGLAYYAYSSLNAGIGPGAWYVSAGVNPSNIEKTIDLITGELKRFVEQGVTDEELADSQTNFIGRLPLSLESNAGVAGALLSIERHDLGLDYYRTYPDLVRAVKIADVQETARKFIDPRHLVVATAGPE